MARIISALVLIPLTILIVIYAPPTIFLVGLGLIGTACLYEYFGLMRAMGLHVQPLWSHLAFWAFLIFFRQGQTVVVMLLALALMMLFLSALQRKHDMRDRAMALMAEALGTFYVSLFLCPAVSIRYDFGLKEGMQWTLLLLAVTWSGDTFALVAGKTFGRHPLAPLLSPKKTYEGAVVGLLSAVIAGVVLQFTFLKNLQMSHVLVASFLIGVFGQLGDLAESLLKRAAATKDSSHLIPGHGGALDRMDSLLFAIPVLYIYLHQLH